MHGKYATSNNHYYYCILSAVYILMYTALTLKLKLSDKEVGNQDTFT